MGKITAAITGVGQYLPEYILTNDELSRMVDTNDEWIMSHTGIKTRHILKGGYRQLLHGRPCGHQFVG